MLTKEDILKRMEEINGFSGPNGDIEASHDEADELLCDILDDLGMQEVTKWFRGLDKWYA